MALSTDVPLTRNTAVLSVLAVLRDNHEGAFAADIAGEVMLTEMRVAKYLAAMRGQGMVALHLHGRYTLVNYGRAVLEESEATCST